LKSALPLGVNFSVSFFLPCLWSVKRPEATLTTLTFLLRAALAALTDPVGSSIVTVTTHGAEQVIVSVLPLLVAELGSVVAPVIVSTSDAQAVDPGSLSASPLYTAFQ